MIHRPELQHLTWNREIGDPFGEPDLWSEHLVALQTGSGDVEHQLPGGEGTRASAGGGAVPSKYSWAKLKA